MAFLLFDNFRQFTSDGGELLTGGYLRFSDPLTTLDKTVYADKDLATPLGAEVELDSAARSPTAIWVSGLVNVELLDSDEVQVGLCENMGEDTSGAAIPDASDGDENDVWSTDGVTADWRAVSEVPDATGQDGKYLGADDGEPTWLAFPAAATVPEVSADDDPTTGYHWSEGILEVWGSGTCPTNGSGLSSTVAITFSHAFDSAPFHVSITPVLSSGITTNAVPGFPTVRYTSLTASGCTVGVFVGEENLGGTDSINATTPFTYWAKGPKATDPGA